MSLYPDRESLIAEHKTFGTHCFSYTYIILQVLRLEKRLYYGKTGSRC